jgi:triacylglycerol esterase/lipase EstA (alpha/beta hydrolase family)
MHSYSILHRLRSALIRSQIRLEYPTVGNNTINASTSHYIAAISTSATAISSTSSESTHSNNTTAHGGGVSEATEMKQDGMDNSSSFVYQQRDVDLTVPLPSLRYPVVLVHGSVFPPPIHGMESEIYHNWIHFSCLIWFFVSLSLFPVSYLGYASLIRAPWPWSGPLLEYFGSVRTHLGESSHGGITVITPVNPPAASIAARAKKLRWALGLQTEEEEANAYAKGKIVTEKPVSGSDEHTERNITASSTSENNDNDNNNKDETSDQIEFANTSGHFDPKKHSSDSATWKQHYAEEKAGKAIPIEPPPSQNNSTNKSTPPKSGTSIILGGQEISLDRYEGKFHLIAHSMGGLDSRYLIAQLESAGRERGDPPGSASNRIASLTTVGSPHRGSPIADMVLDVIDLPFSFSPNATPAILANAPTVNKISQRLANLFGIDVSGITNLSTQSMVGFNKRVQNAPYVYYQSYGGDKNFKPWNIWYWPSKWIREYEILQQEEELKHLSSSTSKLTEKQIEIQHQLQSNICGANDGLVSVNSSRWGIYKGTTNLDHLEQIGLGVLGNRHLPLYRQIVWQLKEMEMKEEEEEKKKKGKK